MIVHRVFDYWADRMPGQLCMRFESSDYSYRHFAEESRLIACHLKTAGIGIGDRVGFLGENCPEMLSVVLACSRLGAVFAPQNYRLAAPEMAYTLKDCEAKILLVPDAGMNALCTQALAITAVDQVVGRGLEGAAEWQDWMAAEPKGDDLEAELEVNADFLQLYTSGTTGHPKGVVLSHRAVWGLYSSGKTALPDAAKPGNVDLLCAPNFHISGTGSLLLTVLGGASSIMHRGFDPQAVIHALEHEGVTSVFMVPAMIMLVVQIIEAGPQPDFSAVEQLNYGASPISPALLRKAMALFPNACFNQAYGMTETCGTVCMLSAEAHKEALAGKEYLLQSCGKPLAGVRMKAADKQGNALPAGETGEIWIHAESNLSHYFKRPEATEETLVNGWVITGDSGYCDEDGYFYLRDRIKDMVVSGGENIYPIEVENVLAEHEAIADVAVIGVPDEKFGEALLACVVLVPGAALELDAMIAFCRERLAGYKIPRQMKVLDALPRNPSGKILKKDLRAPYWEGVGRNIG